MLHLNMFGKDTGALVGNDGFVVFGYLHNKKVLVRAIAYDDHMTYKLWCILYSTI